MRFQIYPILLSKSSSRVGHHPHHRPEPQPKREVSEKQILCGSPCTQQDAPSMHVYFSNGTDHSDAVPKSANSTAPSMPEPEAKGGLITSLQPLRIHCSPSQPPRAPTLQECEVIIRQLYSTNSQQSQESISGYTDEQIAQLRAKRAARAEDDAAIARGMEGEPDLPQAIARTTNMWWCTCSKCTVMPEEIECQCCQENHYLATTLEAMAGAEDEFGITAHAEFRGLIGSWTVETLFWTPNWNWRRRRRGAGP
ncbi:hypothetical protein SKAU_G00281070 [Synaphobranchus kaupii]|uniref:Coiled coil protein 74 C-terminal domain-containing protein n=1 Tax=Synaphobranchus kaupii TaxID=118154 RepID=A0A9Q1INP6_SYNKA|nr:hypothetical protein SKAU_G00281070 [Synaphobranchus kaupii]